MHELELLVRTDSEISSDEYDQLKAESMAISPDDPDEYLRRLLKERPPIYKKMVFDISTVTPFQEHDDDHTMLFIAEGEFAFIAKIKFETFKEVKERMTGRRIYTIEHDFKFDEE